MTMIVPASNLRDCSPFKSEGDSELMSPDQRRRDALLIAARRDLIAGRTETGLAAIEQAVGLDPLYADALYLRGHHVFTPC